MVLCKIVNKKNKIDIISTFRPVHGIHMSPNRKMVDNTNPDWGLEKWKNEWYEFYKSKTFKIVFENLDNDLKAVINKINEYYNINKG